MNANFKTALIAAIGSVLITASECQMTSEGFTKAKKTYREHFGKIALASAGGRPVLTPDYLTSHTVGVAGQQDVIWNPLYDSLAYPSAGQVLFSFYATSQGAGTSSAPGAGAIAKTVQDTNLQINNQLTAGNEFYMIGSESLFYPGVSNASATPAVLPGRANLPTTVGIFVNDIYAIGSGGIKTLTVGTDRKYIQDGPISLFPPATRLAVAAAVATGETAAGEEIAYAAWSGETYTIVPIYFQSNQNWILTVVFPALIPTPSLTIGRLIDRMRGYLVRQAT
jgi:hypothetical protein